MSSDRRRHFLVVGKSAALRNMAMQDIAAGRGFALLDPHGDLAEELFNCTRKYRVNEVVHLAPADAACSIGFNLLAGVKPEARPMVASGIAATFHHVSRDSSISSTTSAPL